jgi:hypothetical protein
MDDMTATVARCHFWWNNFFFSSLFLFVFLRLRLCCCCCWQQHTHIHAAATASAQKKMRFSVFFSSFSFTPFYCFVYGAASASMSRWCSCFLGNDGTTERQGRERRRNALVSTLVSWQAKIYRFAIYYRPLLSSLLCLSLSLPLSFFFVNSALYAHALLFAYTCHCAMFHEHKHTCTNEADDDSSAIISKKKSINAAMTCNL